MKSNTRLGEGKNPLYDLVIWPGKIMNKYAKAHDKIVKNLADEIGTEAAFEWMSAKNNRLCGSSPMYFILRGYIKEVANEAKWYANLKKKGTQP